MGRTTKSCGLDAALATSTLAIVALGPAALALGATPAQPGRPALVIAAPWTDVEAALAAAGGRAIGPVRPRIAALGVVDDPAALKRLAGEVWWIVDGAALARLCGVGVDR
jgi:hypothetical protein